MELCINEMIDDVLFDVKLDTKVCILSGDSGTGKTYLTGVLLAQAMKRGLSKVHFGYDAKDMLKESIINSCRNKDLVVFDNADLYLDADLVLSVEKLCRMLVICIHSLSLVPYVEDRARYSVDFTEKCLRTRKRKG